MRTGVTLGDIILFGAMLASPIPGQRDWHRVALAAEADLVDGLAQR